MQSNSFCSGNYTNQNTVSNWVMVAVPYGPGNSFAQSGILRTAEDGPYRHFVAYQEPSTSTYMPNLYHEQKVPVELRVGENHQYWVQYDSSCRCQHLNVDLSRILDTTGYDPANQGTRYYEMEGETHFRGTDYLGYYPLNTQSTTSGIQSESLGGTYSPMNCSLETYNNSVSYFPTGPKGRVDVGACSNGSIFSFTNGSVYNDSSH